MKIDEARTLMTGDPIQVMHNGEWVDAIVATTYTKYQDVVAVRFYASTPISELPHMYVKRREFPINKGDMVRLLSMPDGNSTQDYDYHHIHDMLTVGEVYEVLDLEGSNIWTTTDMPDKRISFWRGRAIPMDQCEQCDGYYPRGGGVKLALKGFCQQECLEDFQERLAVADKREPGDDFDTSMNA